MVSKAQLPSCCLVPPARFYPVGHQAAPSAKLSEKPPLHRCSPDTPILNMEEGKNKSKKRKEIFKKKRTTGTLGTLVKGPHLIQLLAINVPGNLRPQSCLLHLFLLSETKVTILTHRAGPLVLILQREPPQGSLCLPPVRYLMQRLTKHRSRSKNSGLPLLPLAGPSPDSALTINIHEA